MAEEPLRGHPVTGISPERLPRPRGRFGPLRREQRGTALVEFALIAPLLFLLIFGVVDFGRALDYYNQVTQLAGQGARAAAVNRNPDGSALSSANPYSIQQQLVNTYTKQPELKKGIVACITHVPSGPGDYVTVRVSYNFHFLPLISAATSALGGGLNLVATETERAETAPVDTNGNPTYALGNQDGNMTGCS
ncbi:MAG TPA: TadE/TadG family type IV pilus assembly protein [Gaiellaceae bacterium]|nr:TadE/TadG family type IV pilus assembly protein [Gaiellaceae bacterium]